MARSVKWVISMALVDVRTAVSTPISRHGGESLCLKVHPVVAYEDTRIAHIQLLFGTV